VIIHGVIAANRWQGTFFVIVIAVVVVVLVLGPKAIEFGNRFDPVAIVRFVMADADG